MSLIKRASKDTAGEPGATRRDGLLLLHTLVLMLMSAAKSFPQLAIGTTVQKVKTTNIVDFAVDGRLFRKAATDDLFTLTGAAFGSATTSLFNKYLLLLDASGVASVVACTPAATAAGVIIPDLHTTLDGKSLIGVLQIATVNVVFTPATTSLAAAGVTATYIDGIDVTMVQVLADESNVVFKA